VRVIRTEIPDVVILEPKIHGDERGFFLESYNKRTFREATGADVEFVQDNHSSSRRGVLRGLHFQQPHAQGKLVQVLEGEVFDVVVDVRAGSPTFGRWLGEFLSAETKRQLWVPPGFAHGFLVTSEEALFMYKCTEAYHPDAERSVRWDDPELGIAWPLQEVTLSAKDRQAPPLAALPRAALPTYVR
jgi:dTDP-4-dehydrorhamnose 3,5-epimerase